MKRSVVAVLVLCAGCSIPSLDDVHLSACLSDCSTARHSCTAIVQAKSYACNDSACARDLIIAEEACWDSYTTCAEACIAETERTLKE